MNKGIVAGSVALTLAVAVAGSWFYRRSAAQTVAVSSGTMTERIVARATLVAIDGVAELRSTVEGRVTRVLVREGDAVEAGQLVAEIGTGAALDEELRRREADLHALEARARAVIQGVRPEEIVELEASGRAAKAESELAAEDAERQQQLFDSHTISEEPRNRAKRRAEQTRALFDAAQARLRLGRAGGRPEDVRMVRQQLLAAEALVKMAKREVERSQLTSPIRGVVLTRRADPGDTVNGILDTTSLPLFEIADVTRTEVRVELEEPDMARVALGLQVTVRSNGEPVGTGRVARLGAKCERRSIGSDPSTVRADGLVRSVWVEWDGTPRLWLPLGQRLEASIELPSRSVGARLPRRAVHVRNGGVDVELADGVFRRAKAVRLGVADAEFVEVLGLKEGDRVVLE
jgi:HlyD family secretion protein